MKHFFLLTTILLPFYTVAQLNETFDGPEVTSQYPWQGDVDRFIINGDNELQLKGYGGGDENNLYLSSVPLYNNEWQGKARSEYKGTTGNYFRFFLWCENPDLDRPGEAIYVRMGYTKNNIALCHQTGNIRKTTLIEGRELFKDAEEVEFRVTVDEEGYCTLYSKTKDEVDFFEEGSTDIPLYDGDGYYMIGVKYSSKHFDNKYIDDLYIERFNLKEQGGEDPGDPIVLEEVDEENGKELLLYFNRPVIAEAAKIRLTELGEVDEIYQSEDDLILKLVWEQEREKDKEYTLYYKNLYDTDGNQCEGEHTFFSVYGLSGEKPEPSQPGSIRINEIMADPKGLTVLPETEYIEIYNASEETISLKGWVLVYGDTEVDLTDFDFPANSYLVLYRQGREIETDSGLEMPLSKFPANLANNGKRIQLIDPSGQLVDEVTYEKAKAGKSWEWSVDGWFLSTHERGGTPGGKNSVNSDNPEEPEPETYTYGAILINEVMADPKGAEGLPETEYVELWNSTASVISLKDWTFYYEDKAVRLDSYTISAGEYIIIYKEGREITCGRYGYAMPLSAFPANLANSGKSLAICDPSGAFIDEITYEKAKAGISWEREGDTWYFSTDNRGGTPGEANSDPSADPGENPQPGDSSVEPLDIIFNELLPNPYPEGSEYIELYNRSSESHSLQALSIAVRKSDGELSTQYPLSDITVPLASGEYILLTKEEEGVLIHYSIPYPENIYKVKLPVLNNNASTLVLFRTSDETIIDEISYSSKWHASSVREEKGVSLERIDPEGLTQDADNWTSASEQSGFGTPGYENSQYLKSSQGSSSHIEKPSYSHQTGLYSILYTLDQPGYHCRAYVYNLSGYRVAEIANNELVGTNGEILWNGLGTGQSKLQPGPYIFYIELYHEKGLVRNYKEVFLVY